MAALSQRSVIVVGAGAFGTSTAYHLAQRGYNSVTVLDRWAPPSLEAAATDINKVIRADYPDPLYARLATEATEKWSDPNGLFRGLYHRTGWLLAASDSSVAWIEQTVETAAKLGFPRAQAISGDSVRSQWPAFTGALNDWKTYWNKSGGWANADVAVSRMAEEAQKAGVRYVWGSAGYGKKLLFDEHGACIGVGCADGSAHFADLVVLAAGAAAPSLLDFKGQLVAKGHTVGHVQLTAAEVERYKDIPIVDHLEGGIFFPPQENGIIKIGAVNFVTNFDPITGVSSARYRSDNPTDAIPKPIELHLRKWLKEIVPDLAEREWFETRICWDADMPDYHFLIAPHPSHPGLNLAVGGSAHGFKFMPVLGKYIVDMLEGSLDPAIAKHWRWRPEVKKDPAAVEPHPNPLLDLNDTPGWAKNSVKSSTKL